MDRFNIRNGYFDRYPAILPKLPYFQWSKWSWFPSEVNYTKLSAKLCKIGCEYQLEPDQKDVTFMSIFD